jgi:hypothetical protein
MSSASILLKYVLLPYLDGITASDGKRNEGSKERQEEEKKERKRN